MFCLYLRSFNLISECNCKKYCQTLTTYSIQLYFCIGLKIKTKDSIRLEAHSSNFWAEIKKIYNTVMQFTFLSIEGLNWQRQPGAFMSKDALRSQLLTLRDGLSPARRETLNQRISEKLRVRMVLMRILLIKEGRWKCKKHPLIRKTENGMLHPTVLRMLRAYPKHAWLHRSPSC